MIDPIVVEQLLRASVAAPSPTSRPGTGRARGDGRGPVEPVDRGQPLHRPKTVEAYTGRIFAKLGLAEAPDDHRRVLAVLAHLRSTRPGTTIV